MVDVVSRYKLLATGCIKKRRASFFLITNSKTFEELKCFVT